MYDVVIIGAGVTGCAVAQQLAGYDLKTLVVEKGEDLCCGTSKANSGILHAGFDAAPGSLMAKLNVRGSYLIKQLVKPLQIPYKENGALVLCMDEESRGGLDKLYQQGIANGVSDLRILSREEVLEMEPNLSEEVCGALYAPTSGIVCPFNLTIALAENAADNGTEFLFDAAVNEIIRKEGHYLLKTEKGDIEAKYVVNAAGLFSDKIHNMVSETKYEIIPRKGEYYLLDKNVGNYVKHTIFTLPTRLGKGVLISPTVDGNLIVGPNANDIEDKEGVNTTSAGLAEVAAKASAMVKNLPIRQVITSFAGLRSHLASHDFIVEEVKDAPGFIDCVGIESPGLSSSVAIGEMVRNILIKIAEPKKKQHVVTERKAIVRLNELDPEERNRMIRKNPAYGHIICRCEVVSEGEIVDALHRNIPAKSLDGIKRRVRATAGRCQGGFCSNSIIEIIARERNIPFEEVTKKGGTSKVALSGLNKGGSRNA
ncbi:MAG: NAD(P)/FAD-dependent oxidoreductase [Erysipelotrichaceae bacterium]|nr:NAD(P)/FAD-dependent oxidoreductase [Erysipelotrichaceae bacterium]